MLNKLLIANRGEIACRVVRTARRLGLKTVAVYSDVDAGAQHVKVADDAVLIGGAAAADSYLNAEAIITAAIQSGADAIHPGYGFLSENPEFAEACLAAGLTFCRAAVRSDAGHECQTPRPRRSWRMPVFRLSPDITATISLRTSCSPQRRTSGFRCSSRPLPAAADAVCASSTRSKIFARALEGAKREAASGFGNDRVLIERYLTKSRHIEIQVFGDTHGNVIHLFERECSLQRRHQKVIEEAPAPGMTLEVRAAMGEAAVSAARAIDYVGAGTVEFIVDGDAGLNASAFYFMEMNTRLQVEHPVTELITGLDLVEWQLNIAAGDPLPLTQDEVVLTGHAIEARIYAENPAKKFLPSPGNLSHLRLPDQGLPHPRRRGRRGRGQHHAALRSPDCQADCLG